MPRPRTVKRSKLRRNALNVRFNDEEYSIIARSADRHNTSLSDLVRTIVIRHLDPNRGAQDED